MYIYFWIKSTKKQLKMGFGCKLRREAVGGKPAKTGDDVDAAAKERPKEAPFADLRPHDYRLRTWSRMPAAKPTRPISKKDNQKNTIFVQNLQESRPTIWYST